MKFLLSTRPGAGHYAPMSAVARELVARGHEVVWHASADLRARIEALGVRFAPMRHAFDFWEQAPGVPVGPADDPRRLSGLAAARAILKLAFVNSMVGQARDFEEILADFPADVLLVDSTTVGASLLAEKTGQVWATLNVSVITFSHPDTGPVNLALPPATNALQRLRYRAMDLLFWNVLARSVNAAANQRRAEYGLGPLPRGANIPDQTLSPWLFLQQGTPSLDYPRRTPLPAQVHFIGALLPAPAAGWTPPEWWPEVTSGAKRVILVTQGTVTNDSADLLVPTLRGLADAEDLLVVATTGGPSAAELPIQPLPANARVVPFLPYEELLPHAAAMVTNGGFGGVQMALAAGVPLIAAGTTEEKPEVCARIAYAGVGINLKTRAPSPEQVRDAVRTLLAEPAYRSKAAAMAAELAAHDAPREAADLLERLATTRKPVISS